MATVLNFTDRQRDGRTDNISVAIQRFALYVHCAVKYVIVMFRFVYSRDSDLSHKETNHIDADPVRNLHRRTSQGARGCSPQTRVKPLFFGQKLFFRAEASSQK